MFKKFLVVLFLVAILGCQEEKETIPDLNQTEDIQCEDGICPIPGLE